jgi:hypothetical protein
MRALFYVTVDGLIAEDPVTKHRIFTSRAVAEKLADEMRELYKLAEARLWSGERIAVER